VGKKIFGYLIAFLVGGIIFASCIFIYGQGYYNRIIDKLSVTITNLEQSNTELKGINSSLSETNKQLGIEISRSQSAVTELTERLGSLDRANKDYQRRITEMQGSIGEIGNGLAGIAEALTGTGGTIQGIIEGLQYIKEFISKLETN